jgi:hypothetical protein
MCLRGLHIGEILLVSCTRGSDLAVCRLRVCGLQYTVAPVLCVRATCFLVPKVQINCLYIHVNVRRYSFLFNNQPDALIIQIYCHKTLHVSGNFFCPSSGVFYSTFGTGKFHAGYDDRFQAESGHFHPDSAWKRSSETCMKPTNAECTV